MQMLHSGIDDARDCAPAASAYLYHIGSNKMLRVCKLKGSTMTSVSNVFSGHVDFVAHIKLASETARKRLAQYRAYRQTYRELSDMSGRDLADLGIHPSHIRSLALEAAYKN